MDEVIAFGDGDNDLEMLSQVGHGVAMENAMPSPKAATKHRAKLNDEGGVGLYLTEIFK
jgi:5-amino-6-(5-phospho-D-ribitylamino)uracil phosphatase